MKKMNQLKKFDKSNLLDGEEILSHCKATNNQHSGVTVILTNMRLIFFRSKLFGEEIEKIKIKDITGVSFSSGFIFNKINISLGGMSFFFYGDKKKIKKFFNDMESQKMGLTIKKEEKKKKSKISFLLNCFGGIFIVFSILAIVFSPTDYKTKTLDDFIDFSEKEKKEAISQLLQNQKEYPENGLIVCLERRSVNHNLGLLLEQLNICKDSWSRNEKLFNKKNNIFSNKKESQKYIHEALVMCQNAVERDISPIVPDFSIFSERRTFLKEEKYHYIVKDTFNVLNGSLSYFFHCDIKYKGTGEVLLDDNWSINILEIYKN